MVWFDIHDSQGGLNLQNLVGKSFMFRGRRLLFAAAMKVSGLPQCQCCWRWGHHSNAKSCPFHGLSCPICGEPHQVNNHCDYASCCKGDTKSTPPHEPTSKGQPCSHSPHCINCGKPHRSDLLECHFFESPASIINGSGSDTIMPRSISFCLDQNSSLTPPSLQSSSDKSAEKALTKFSSDLVNG